MLKMDDGVCRQLEFQRAEEKRGFFCGTSKLPQDQSFETRVGDTRLMATTLVAENTTLI